MIQYAGIWFPDDGTLTKALRARLDTETVYRGDRLEEALRHVRVLDRGHARSDGLAIDCGANVGMWTRELAKRFERVVAIEPSPTNVECLIANTAELDNVTVVDAAAGEATRSAGLATGKGGFGAHVAPEGAPVRMVTIDSLGLAAVDYLKVHVNGYELPALKGAAATLSRCRPVLTVVLKPALERFDTKPQDVIAWLEGRSYRLAGGQKPYRIFVPA